MCETLETRVERNCLDCGISIAHRPVRTKRCIKCAYQHSLEYGRKYREENKEYFREYYKKHRTLIRRVSCLNCGVSIEDRGCSAKWCLKCRNEKASARKIKRYRSDPAHREHLNNYRKERYHTNEEYRKRKLELDRIRGRTYRKRRNIEALIKRDGLTCEWCGEPINDPFNRQETHVDHIKPVSKGGGNELSNLRLLHATCNVSRGNREE